MLEIYRRYLRYYKKEVFLGPLFKLFEAIFELIVPLIMAKIIDDGINEGNTVFIWQMGLVLFGLALFGLLSTLVCQYFAAKASQGVGTRLRNDLFKKVLELDYLTFSEYGPEAMLTRINNDVNQVQLSVAMLIRLVIRAPFLVLGASVMALLISPIYGLVFIIAAIIIGLIVLLIMKRTIPYNKQVQKDLEQVTRIAKENLNGARVVRAFNNERAEELRFKEATSVNLKDSLRVGKISALLNPASTIVINSVIILIIYLGGNMVNESLITQGDVTALVNYISQILVAMLVICNLIVIFGKSLSASDRVKEILDIKIEKSYGNSLPKKGEFVYEFQDVSFIYPRAAQASITGLNFRIRQGDFVGIIGSTGSGKTTLLSLFNRLFDPTTGTILYKGEDLKSYSKEMLDSDIKVVLQQANLASDTIYNNLAWGNPNLSEEDAKLALRLAKADFAINRGLDYQVYQGGKNLSGGERSRLSLARAIVARPQVLLLDDVSAALDYKTDLELRQNLATLGITTIMVSQRVNSIKNATMIIVLDEGRITGVGRHEELLVNNRIYQEIYRSQQGDNYEK